jgi:hypothetical protein
MRRIDWGTEILGFRPFPIDLVAYPDISTAFAPWSVTHDVQVIPVTGKQRFNLQMLGAYGRANDLRLCPLAIDEK